jgi:hypothetical protein
MTPGDYQDLLERTELIVNSTDWVSIQQEARDLRLGQVLQNSKIRKGPEHFMVKRVTLLSLS